MFFFLFSCSTENKNIVVTMDKSDIKAYNLIDPIFANKLLKENPNEYIPIQVSKHKIFQKEHIPNAINIWRPDYGSDVSNPFGGLIPSREKLENLIQNFGFKKGKTLLIYDAKANVDALRFAWVLNLYGFDDFKIINGGLKFWKINGLAVTDKISEQPTKSNFHLSDFFDKSMIANFDEVLSAIKDSNTIIVDTREAYEYKGLPFILKDSVYLYKKGAFNRGSIPTAIHFNWSNLADLNGDHRIKSEKDLNHDLNNIGINRDKKIILYCQSGSRTSHTYYVLKHILGYSNVKNYDGSWIEWSYRHSLDNSIPLEQIIDIEKFETIRDSLNLSINYNE